MSLYSIIDKNIFLPMADLLTHRGLAKEWRFMEKTDRMSEEELMFVQNERLQKLMEHCYKNVPYYTKLFDSLGLKPSDIKCRKDLEKLPVLTKQMVRDNYNDLISKDAEARHPQQGSTGGSTGTPLKFMKDVQTWNMAWASSFRAWDWYGFHLGEKLMTLGGNSLVSKKKKLSAKDVFDLYVMRNVKRSSAEVDDAAMLAHYEAFMNYKPAAMRGYASSLVILARYIERMALPVHQMKVILTTGEILMPEYRATLERVFKCPVYDEYGAGDGGVDAHECLAKDGLHLSEERCVVEITDKEGRCIADGEIGYVTTTDLGNYAFPFIRYQVGDMAYIKPDKCQCGRQSRVLGKVIGRAGKLIYNKQGVPLSPTMLPFFLYRNMDYHSHANAAIYNRIDKFQFRQDKEGNITVLLKLKDGNEDVTQFDYVKPNLDKYFEGSVNVVKFVNDIPCLPSGKEDYCVSEYEFKG